MVQYDAIVVGSGISGGWAAKELCEKGLKTLVLERGRNVTHIKDYPTAFKRPWDFQTRLINTNEDKNNSPVQSTGFNPADKHFYVNDSDHPYIQDKPFNWVRGYQVGGKSLIWGRQCYRLSDLDFGANKLDDVAIDWPIRYKDLEKWYGYVEEFVGISGKNEGLPHLPDSNLLPPIEMNCIENHFKDQISKNYKDRIVTHGRTANLTKRKEGRGPCQYRNLCSRGCPFGAYFSSNAATLPAAQNTGNMTLKTDSIVKEILYDSDTGKATGVTVIDSNTKLETTYKAGIIFINAGTIPSTAILLNSKSEQFPNGLGNSSGQLGHHLMDHFLGAGAEGAHYGMQDKYYAGRNPGCIYIPRFRNTADSSSKMNFKRGYAYQGYGERVNWNDKYKSSPGFGKRYKEDLQTPGAWRVWLGAWGETLPYFENKMYLSEHETDQWGLPLVHIDFEYGENEKMMREDIKTSAYEMLDKAGFENIQIFDYKKTPGSAVHEMGTARMGSDPKTSVLNQNNQLHDVPNVFVTDGSCMTSSAAQNPSLTYMAMTARACDYAVSEMKKGNL